MQEESKTEMSYTSFEPTEGKTLIFLALCFSFIRKKISSLNVLVF
jgi:hypothetical protein